MAKKSLFFRKEIVKKYFENEPEKHFQDLLKKRNISEEIDENILTTHLFIALRENILLNKFLKKVMTPSHALKGGVSRDYVNATL